MRPGTGAWRFFLILVLLPAAGCVDNRPETEGAPAPAPAPATGPEPCQVGAERTLAMVPEPGYPFGLAVRGDAVFVSTSRGGPSHPGDGRERVFAIDTTGNVTSSVDVATVPGATMGLWDLALDRHEGGERLYIVDMNGRVLRADIGAELGEIETYATTPLPQGAFQWFGSMLLGLAFGPDDAAYVADDHGRIWQIPPGGSPEIWLESTDLLGAAVLVAGPNGLRFGPDGDLYVAVSSSATPTGASEGIVFRIGFEPGGPPGQVEAFARFPQSPPDGPVLLTGLAFGASGTLYVSLGPRNEVAVVGPDGLETGRLAPADLYAPFGLAFLGDELLVASSDFVNPAPEPDHWRIIAVCVGEAGLALHVPTTIP